MRTPVALIAVISTAFLAWSTLGANPDNEAKPSFRSVSESENVISSDVDVNAETPQMERKTWNSVEGRLEYIAQAVVRNYPAESCHAEDVISLFDSVDPKAKEKLVYRQKTIDYQHSVNTDMGHSDFSWDISTSRETYGEELVELRAFANYSYQTLWSPERSFSQIEVTMLVKIEDGKLRLISITSDDTFDHEEWTEPSLLKKNSSDYKHEYEEYISALQSRLGEPEIVPTLPKGVGYMEPNRSLMKAYMERWAYSFNPSWGNFTSMGGDCTNYASQVMYAGTPGFDQQGTHKWYYSGYNSRSPSWTSVLALRGYLLSNRGEVGHYSGFLTSKTYLKTGDIVQLGNYHSVVVYRNNSGTIYVSAHTSAALNKPLSDYGNPALTCIQLKWYSNNTSI